MNTPWCIHMVKTADLKLLGYIKSEGCEQKQSFFCFLQRLPRTSYPVLKLVQPGSCLHHRKSAPPFPATSASPVSGLPVT